MDVRNGDLYPSLDAALAAGVPEESAIEVRGQEKAIKDLALAIAEREALRDALSSLAAERDAQPS